MYIPLALISPIISLYARFGQPFDSSSRNSGHLFGEKQHTDTVAVGFGFVFDLAHHTIKQESVYGNAYRLFF